MEAGPVRFLDLLSQQIQYVVPIWQRRYCWGQEDIERLVEDLVTVANAKESATHYGGTLLTFPDPGPEGVIRSVRVVDGQQRLTTVSVLLANIGRALGEKGNFDGWTKDHIFNQRLQNVGQPPDKRLKLKLQPDDYDEYRRGLEGAPTGPGAITQAWILAQKLVNEHGVEVLLRGLMRLQVVSISLEGVDDPQQIFESLNATGRPLSVSEKVKNWLLMGLPDEEQKELYEKYWCKIESELGAAYSSNRLDEFLWNVLKWRTGRSFTISQAYDGFRRWAIQEGLDENRPALCRELARLSTLYGRIIGTVGESGHIQVDRELHHLRQMSIDAHRPLTLRLLNDYDQSSRLNNESIGTLMSRISAWTTRLWLANRPTAGLAKVAAELASRDGPKGNENADTYWVRAIDQLRNRLFGVPSDEDVREGVRNRKAYGGSTTKLTTAVLCELMESEQPDEAPKRSSLTIEHIMPRALTSNWKSYLGDEAEQLHEAYCNRFANLTLSGDVTNSSMGSASFSRKRDRYQSSAIFMTRRVGAESDWDEAALTNRAEDLADRILQRWPWQHQESIRESVQHSTFKWRLGSGAWHEEPNASQLVLNVTATLLSENLQNRERLSGKAATKNIQPITKYPAGRNSNGTSLTMVRIPGHDQFVLYPYTRDYPSAVELCKSFAARCDLDLEVEYEDRKGYSPFWSLLKERTGGLPGQKNDWRGPTQFSRSDLEDIVAVSLTGELVRLYIRPGFGKKSEMKSQQMSSYSNTIQTRMSDQLLGRDIQEASNRGQTIQVMKQWDQQDEAEWPSAAEWIWTQCGRLHSIVEEHVEQASDIQHAG